MIFATYWFIVFIAIAIPVYWIVHVPWLRLGLLLAACSIFHAKFAGPAGMVPIIALCVTTYLAGLSRRPWVLHVGMALPVLALIFYKYTHFFSLQVLTLVSPHFGQTLDAELASYLPSAPPLGVSFFVFEFVHYLYEVRKGHPPIRNPAYFWAFTFFFPSLVAGPIKRYEPFVRYLREGLGTVTLDDVKYGLWRVSIGYVKKIGLADNLTAGLQFWHPHYAELSLSGRWLFVITVALRVLLDFSGYSDIAIGLSRMMGIRLLENFRWPYLAKNLQEYWRRWHISLSSWIRDYVYIPLGGSRQGMARKAFNGVFAFSLCGLWHGPNWNYVTWGVWHGTGLVVSTNYTKVLGPPGRMLARVFARAPLLSWALTMLFTGIGHVFFFYPVGESIEIVRRLFVR